MKKFIIPAVFVVVGLLLAVPVFSMAYYTMVRTSTPEFCASCHEIEYAFNTWRTSTHVNNGQGLVADCMDCHIPAPRDMLAFFYTKTAHGLKDVIVHFTTGDYDRRRNKETAWRTIKNDQCMKCHRNLLYIPDKRGAMLAHRDVLFPRPGYEKRCLDCHRNLVHNPSPVYRYKQYQGGYRAVGFM